LTTAAYAVCEGIGGPVLGGGARSVLGLVLLLAALTVGHLLLIPAAGSAIALAAVLLIAGATIAPTEASVYGMVEDVTPQGTVTEAFAWLATAIAVGSALGAAGAGALADQAGPTAAYLLGACACACACAGAFAALIALARAATTTATGWRGHAAADRADLRRRLSVADRFLSPGLVVSLVDEGHSQLAVGELAVADPER
jgi:MFS family permease